MEINSADCPDCIHWREICVLCSVCDLCDGISFCPHCEGCRCQCDCTDLEGGAE
jgi:alkyl hydroperoxide reductase subunit AhpF